LRHSEVLTVREMFTPSDAVGTVGASAGTAAVLGLRRVRQTDAPTTAYLMVGERCGRDCAFCAQARSSTSRSHFLSRIAWMPYPSEQVLHGVARGFEQHKVVRCCLQVTVSPGCLWQARDLVREIHAVSSIPICVSIVLARLDGVRALLESGAERVTLALDAACERVYSESKGRDWRRQLDLLETAARHFPGHIGTHLIAGLGETEWEMVTILQEMVDRRVTVGLFSFTPVPGTRWGDRMPPLLASYRRIQSARHLLVTGVCRAEEFQFSPEGQIASYGVRRARLLDVLADGRAFQTAGCPGCNRPYYNERPGKTMYNYPRPLDAREIEAAITLVLDGLVHEQPLLAAGQ